MANPEHLERLKRGVEEWNQWRKQSEEIPDFSGSDFTYTNLTSISLISINLSSANLSKTDFSFTDLSNANLSGADLTHAYFCATNLRNVNLSGADLSFTCFNDADVSGADFYRANLWHVDLEGAKLRGSNLSDTSLSNANLKNANLSGANLGGTNLSGVQASGTDLSAATLTGVCIEDWHINSSTNLNDIICEFFFLKGYHFQRQQFADRRPHDPNATFKPGEFAALVQKSLETVDLIFLDGIDWKALLASLEDLKVKYGDQLSIQGVERKTGGAFLVRLEVPAESDKGLIEWAAKELYETKLQILEARYRQELQAKEREIAIYKQQSADMMEVVRVVASRPFTVEVKAVAENNQAKTVISGNKFGGGLAADGGTQIGGTFNDYSQTIGSNLDEITRLILSLREQAQAFPEASRDDVLVHLGDLEEDIQQPEKCQPKRMKARLAALLGIAVALGGGVATATDFANNVLELSNKLNIELVKPQPLSQSSSQPQLDSIARHPCIGMGASGRSDLAQRDEELLWSEG